MFQAGTGPAPNLEDELFFEDPRALYHIDVCYTMYGENSALVRNGHKEMIRPLTAVTEEESLTEIMADRATVALHGASRFTLGLAGCPHCCVSPYMKDFDVIMLHPVESTDAGVPSAAVGSPCVLKKLFD